MVGIDGLERHSLLHIKICPFAIGSHEIWIKVYALLISILYFLKLKGRIGLAVSFSE